MCRHLAGSRVPGYLVVPILVLAASGCGGSLHPVGTSPDAGLVGEAGGSASMFESLGQPASAGDVQTSALGVYTLDVDPESLEAQVSLREVRSGQANDDLYALSIDSFLRSDSLRVKGVRGTATTVDVEYTISHPFPAPSDPTGTPNGSTNRADLGIAGMVLFLTDVTSATGNSYFTDKVANTAMVANADAYYAPGQLLNLTGIANTFPYRQLVDEATPSGGSRIGVDNGSDVTGNFGSDGWTRTEFGASNDAWTGYGVLHQGQTSVNTVSLNRAALSGGFSLDIAVIAKYNDPRGGTTPSAKKGNRLPPVAADASLFAYRMPHGALDVSSIEVLPSTGQFLANTISSSTLNFRIDDFDARATETVAADLSEDAAFTTVAVGESGAPALSICIPGVLGDATTVIDWAPGDLLDDDSAYAGGDAALDTGIPGDALYFTRQLTNTALSGQTPGTHVGLLRVTDPEVDLLIGLDPDLNPLPTSPAPITYQSFTVDLANPNAAPVATVVVTTPTVSPGGAVSIAVSGVSDGENEPIDILVDWDNNGSYMLAGTLNSPYPGSTPFTSPITYAFAGPAPDIRDLPVRLDDGSNQVDIAPTLTFEVLQSNCPSPVPPKTATDITTGMWSTVAGVGASYWAIPTGTAPWPAAWTHGANAGAGFRTTSIGGSPSGFIGQTVSTSGGFYDFLRMRPGLLVTDPPIVQIVTSMDTMPTSPLTQRQVSDLEIDSNNRVIFTLRTLATYSTVGSASLNYSGNAVNWYWFDYSGSVVAETGLNTVTTSVPLVAIALDKDDNLFGLDGSHVMHKWIRSGISAYTEVLTAPYPLDLKLPPISIGANTGTLAANRKIHDFTIDWYNGASFFLVENAATGANDGFVYRVECDGGFSATLAGNPNPRVISVSDGSAQLTGNDILIDNLNAAGAVGNHADVQILVIGQNAIAGAADEFILNSNLGLTLSYDTTSTGAKAAFGYSDGTGWPNNVRAGGNAAGSVRLYYPTPTGWQ